MAIEQTRGHGWQMVTADEQAARMAALKKDLDEVEQRKQIEKLRQSYDVILTVGDKTLTLRAHGFKTAADVRKAMSLRVVNARREALKALGEAEVEEEG